MSLRVSVNNVLLPHGGSAKCKFYCMDPSVLGTFKKNIANITYLLCFNEEYKLTWYVECGPVNTQITIFPEAKGKKKQKKKKQKASWRQTSEDRVPTFLDFQSAGSNYRFTFCLNTPASLHLRAANPPRRADRADENLSSLCHPGEEDMASRVAALLVLLGVFCIQLVSGRNQEPPAAPAGGCGASVSRLPLSLLCSSDIDGLLQDGLDKEAPAAGDCQLQHPGGRKRVRHQGHSVSALFAPKNHINFRHQCRFYIQLVLFVSSGVFRIHTKGGYNLCVSHPDDQEWVRSHIEQVDNRTTRRPRTIKRKRSGTFFLFFFFFLRPIIIIITNSIIIGSSCRELRTHSAERRKMKGVTVAPFASYHL